MLAILDSHGKWPHRRIHHLELRKALAQAQIIAPEEVPADVVTLDADIRVRNSKTRIDRDFTVVCATQADMSEGQLSVLGSLGAILFGHRQGDEVESPMSGGIQRLQIEKVTQRNGLPLTPMGAGASSRAPAMVPKSRFVQVVLIK